MNRIANKAGIQRSRSWLDLASLAQLLSNMLGRLHNVVVAIGPRLDDRLQPPAEARHLAAVAVVRRIIGAAVKWFQMGREKYGHRPSAMAGRADHEVHVNLIDIRPL